MKLHEALNDSTFGEAWGPNGARVELLPDGEVWIDAPDYLEAYAPDLSIARKLLRAEGIDPDSGWRPSHV